MGRLTNRTVIGGFDLTEQLSSADGGRQWAGDDDAYCNQISKPGVGMPMSRAGGRPGWASGHDWIRIGKAIFAFVFFLSECSSASREVLRRWLARAGR